MSAAVSDLSGHQVLLLYNMEDLENRKVEPDTLFNFDVASPQSFRFSEDGKYLYGSSFYTGVSNIFRVDMTDNSIAAMSNAVTGLFRPTLISEDSLFAFNFSSDGFQPCFIPNEPITDVSNISFLGNITVEKHPELIDWQVPISSSSDLDMDSLIVQEGTYNAGKEMKLNFAYPTVVGYKNNVGVGYKMKISDPFNFRKLNLSFAYTPREWVNNLLPEKEEEFVQLGDEELFHLKFDYEAGKYHIFGSYNAAEFHDLFGPAQGSRKGVKLGISHKKGLVYDPPRSANLSFSLSGFYGLDQSPEYQQIVVSGFNKNFYLNASSTLSMSNASASLGAVDTEKGYRMSLHGSSAWSAGNFFPRVIGTFDYGIQLPGRHFSLWLRTAAGSSFSDTFNPFTRFGFGAFGNNYIDYHQTKQYRGPFSFPGVSFNSDRFIIGQRFAKAMAEFVMPAIRFRKLGGFNFFANWIQPTVFTSILYSNDSIFPSNKMYNMGAQLDLRMVTFSLNPSTLSVGYGRAFEVDGSESYGEWMISLKLLH